MSQRLVGANPHLKRLRDEGYDIKVVGTHLVVGSIPYVTTTREVKKNGLFVSTLEMDGNVPKLQPLDHTVWFAGEVPCDKNGVRLDAIIHSQQKATPAPGVEVDFYFSSKPKGTLPYPDYHAKISTYVKILCHEAQAIDPSVTAKVFPPVPVDDDDDSPFQYFDTSSSRAGIEALAYKLALPNVAIIGVGGTGSYILDHVARTRVAKIHIFDNDDFSQHNAFRSPGAVALAEITPGLKKVEHYGRVYTKIHKGIVQHPYRITASNTSELAAMSFVFLCLDSGEEKDAIMRILEASNIPFIDVGMGLQNKNDALCGILRVTSSTVKRRDHIRDKGRVSFAPAAGPNDYSRNIQVSELNALNAALAVLKWKKLFGFHHDISGEHHTTFVIETNKLGNEDE